MTARTVLEGADIARALTRISHEIIEANKGADGLVLVGIPTRGSLLAKRIAANISRIEGIDLPAYQLDITMYRDDLAKNPTRPPQPTEMPVEGIDGATVVLIDDVLYSGRTVRAALDALNDHGRPHAVRLAALIDRGHRELPIRADYIGKNLPSAKDERISLRLAEIDGEDSVAIVTADPLPSTGSGNGFAGSGDRFAGSGNGFAGSGDRFAGTGNGSGGFDA